MSLRNFILISISSLFLFSCGPEDGNVPLEGTWTLHRGGSSVFGAPKNSKFRYQRKISFQVHPELQEIHAFFSNGNLFKEPIGENIDRIVFYSNSEYVLYHGGITFGTERIFRGLKGYEAGTFDMEGDFLNLHTRSKQGFASGEELQRPGMEFKLEGDSLTLLWREQHPINDPKIFPAPFHVNIVSKIIFKKVSSETVLPRIVPQNAGSPDEFNAPHWIIFWNHSPRQIIL